MLSLRLPDLYHELVAFVELDDLRFLDLNVGRNELKVLISVARVREQIKA